MDSKTYTSTQINANLAISSDEAQLADNMNHPLSPNVVFPDGPACGDKLYSITSTMSYQRLLSQT